MAVPRPGPAAPHLRPLTLTALALLPVLALATGLRDVSRDAQPYLGGWHWQALATAGMEAVLVVAGSAWLVGLAAGGLRATGPRATGWARGAYVAFVVQGPVLMGVATAARPLDMPAEAKAPLVAVLAIALCFWLGRRLTSPTGRTGPSPPRPDVAVDAGGDTRPERQRPR